MKLWLIEDRARWGYSRNIVRAATARDAFYLVLPHSDYDVKSSKTTIEELPVDGPAKILWCEDESPDTGG